MIVFDLTHICGINGGSVVDLSRSLQHIPPLCFLETELYSIRAHPSALLLSSFFSLSIIALFPVRFPPFKRTALLGVFYTHALPSSRGKTCFFFLGANLNGKTKVKAIVNYSKLR